MKYKVICRGCLAEFGLFDTPNIEMPAKCDKCGSSQIATVEDRSRTIEQLDFDVVIANKRTGASKTCGFFISKEAVENNRKNLNKMRKILASEIAMSLHTIIQSDALLVELLKQGDE